MTLLTHNNESGLDDWSMPSWVKVILSFFASSAAVIFVRSMLSPQTALLGISTERISIISFGFVLSLLLAVLVVWFFPRSAFTLFFYWLIRFFREQLSVFSLLGIVYLITIRVPPLSLRGGIPLLNLTLLFLMGLFVTRPGTGSFPLSWMGRAFASVKTAHKRINSLPTLPLSIVVATLPIVIIVLVIYVGLQSSLANYGPHSFWNDETGYWLWIRSFSQVGFHVGYNAPYELIAPAHFNHYGEGSPFYIYIYGLAGRLIGWSPQLPLVINFFILALAIFLFVRWTKLEPVQILFVGLITTVTWPILLYLPMTTHETLNQGIGFVLAVVFWKLLTRRAEVSLPARLSFVVLVYLAALIRLSWGLLLIPVLFYALDGPVFRRLLLSFVVGLGLYLSAILITSYLVPPTNNSILQNIKNSIVDGPQLFARYIWGQISQMFAFKQLNPNIAVMFQIMIVIGWNLIRLVRSIRAKIPLASILQSQSVLDIYVLASLTVGGLLFYLQEGFYRTFTPSILIVYLLQTTRKDYRLLVTLLTLNLLFFHSYMTFYAKQGDAQIIRADFTTEFPERTQWQSETEKWITFDAAAQNPWCNTILVPIYYYDYRLTVVPAGIGFSWFGEVSDLQDRPLHSKYLLIDQEAYELLAKRAHIELLAPLSIGDLYYNRDSGCELHRQ